jgi:hypothetical protein
LFEGLIYQFVYSLERHRLFSVRLRYWLVFSCFILPAAVWLKLWKTSPVAAVLVTLAALSLLAATWWAGRQRYVRFVEHGHNPGATLDPGEEGINREADQGLSTLQLPAMGKVHVRATGFFEVSGMRRYLVETPADYTTFETREHCVMARVPLSRFLLLAKSSPVEVGWWYTFFQPAMIRAMQGGCLYFGLRPRPALRLQIALPDNSREETLHLSFDDEAAREMVLADLRLDAKHLSKNNLLTLG